MNSISPDDFKTVMNWLGRDGFWARQPTRNLPEQLLWAVAILVVASATRSLLNPLLADHLPYVTGEHCRRRHHDRHRGTDFERQSRRGGNL
ncbi:MAG: hypothetical protein ACK5JT_11150 [Hyphomicrobiaceae bacterium]